MRLVTVFDTMRDSSVQMKESHVLRPSPLLSPLSLYNRFVAQPERDFLEI
jgi:hypothetical protein